MATSEHTEWQKTTATGHFQRLIGEGVPRARAIYMAAQYVGALQSDVESWLRGAGL